MPRLNYLLDKFLRSITPTKEDLKKLRERHVHLREQVLESFNEVNNTILAGSYKRKTLLRPIRDVDVLVVLDAGAEKKYPEPKKMLEVLKAKLKNADPKIEIIQDKPCLALVFDSYTFELMPVIEQKIENRIHFLMPDKTLNTWQQIEHPNVLKRKLSEKNARFSGKISPLIRMVKCCKRNTKRVLLKSYQIEERAIDSLQSINDYRDGLEQLLKACNAITPKEYNALKRMNETAFIECCRQHIFGTDFPND